MLHQNLNRDFYRQLFGNAPLTAAKLFPGSAWASCESNRYQLPFEFGTAECRRVAHLRLGDSSIRDTVSGQRHLLISIQRLQVQQSGLESAADSKFSASADFCI